MSEKIEPKYVEGSGKAPLVKIQGEEVYIPRRERRRILRAFKTNVLKGRIDLNALNEKRLELNRDRNESGE